MKPVSYTHLDVYKRQGVDNGNGLESFKNTPNDSMFVELNSDSQIKYSYAVSYTHLDVYKRQVKDFQKRRTWVTVNSLSDFINFI